jgi:phenylalanyl-tRNA synthetase beta chain
MDDLALHDVMVYEPRELFRAAGAHAHQYSLLLSTVFQAPDRTLQDEEVQAWSKQVMEAMARLGGALRK